MWLADLEDASCPTWANVIDALLNLRDAARGTLSFTQPTTVASTGCGPISRSRSWSCGPAAGTCPRRTCSSTGSGPSAVWSTSACTSSTSPSNCSTTATGPYYYLPKLESHLEARLWNDVFSYAEERLGIPYGTIRATVLIETIPAAFEMEEILYELHDHASGLNAGRWDYLFSIIKYFRDAGGDFVLVDRADITMTAPFMRAYTELLVPTCHRRGAFAMGGMAAFIPSRKDAGDQPGGLRQGHRGQDPGGRGRLRRLLGGPPRSGAGLPGGVRAVLGTSRTSSTGSATRSRSARRSCWTSRSAQGDNTEAGLRNNLYVAVAYTAAWLSGNGAVGIHNLMEDAATAEISRSQVWQEIRNRSVCPTPARRSPRTGRPAARQGGRSAAR